MDRQIDEQRTILHEQRTMDAVKNYMQNASVKKYMKNKYEIEYEIEYENGYDIRALQNMLNSLETIKTGVAQTLTENGIDSDEFLDDEDYQIIDTCIDVVRQEIEIAMEKGKNLLLTGPRKTARITSSIRSTGQRSEGGRKRTRRHRKSRKSRRHRKSRRR